MVVLSPAERLLQKFGITDPDEIDLEAIAWHLGVRIKYRQLDGCEARIVGDSDRAIISVQEGVSAGRKRFSIGHELGHWHFHRGQVLICRDIGQGKNRKPETERLADQYAADLLMPAYLFRSVAGSLRKLTWEGIRKLADLFSTSITATAIRFLDLDIFPALLVCYAAGGRRWFVRSKSIPERWFPQDHLSDDSYAIDVLRGRHGEHVPALTDADCWFDCGEARDYMLYEQSVRLVPGEVLTLLVPNDAEMLDDVDRDRSWRR